VRVAAQPEKQAADGRSVTDDRTDRADRVPPETWWQPPKISNRKPFVGGSQFRRLARNDATFPSFSFRRR
jgi:hypothetical protein